MTPARDPEDAFLIWEEVSSRSNWEKALGRRHLRRHLGGGIWEEKSEERHLGELWEGLWERALGGLREGSKRALGRTLGALGLQGPPRRSGRVSTH